MTGFAVCIINAQNAHNVHDVYVANICSISRICFNVQVIVNIALGNLVQLGSISYIPLCPACQKVTWTRRFALLGRDGKGEKVFF